MTKRNRGWLAALMTLFGKNWITLSGASLSAISGVLIVGFLLLGIFEASHSPYTGIMVFFVLPALFVGGLLLVPIGAFWERRRLLLHPEEVPDGNEGPFPKIDFNHPHTRRVAGIVVVLTAMNLLIVSTVAYQGVLFTESVTFCGTLCHTVMEPEHMAYLDSPHSRVRCVECHIGPGAPWFVRSKLSGLGQVIAVTLGNYEKPIPTPVENLRPSRDTCEECHWPEKFAGDRVKVITKFEEDEANSPTKTVLLLHVGGGNAQKAGIHNWHIAADRKTTYLAVDKQRQKIARVRVTESDGSVMEFTPPEGTYTPEELAGAEERVMDCIDCHNRPTHIYQMPEQAVNKAMADGRIDPALPYIRKVGVEALTAAKGEDEGDLDRIAQQVDSYYKQNYADRYESDQA
ncbi:MAG: hypothetical protein QG656_1822, partial [Candidatus Hydrogenedentes bacterium]|nr:hypothetical protein [Candidatus Hydrogenedentota bacterium]